MNFKEAQTGLQGKLDYINSLMGSLTNEQKENISMVFEVLLIAPADCTLGILGEIHDKCVKKGNENKSVLEGMGLIDKELNVFVFGKDRLRLTAMLYTSFVDELSKQRSGSNEQ